MLVELGIGQICKVRDLSKIDVLVRRRLQDLGVTEGSTVVMKNKTPFGGPIMITSNGQALAIRRSQAMKIGVEKV